MKTISKTIFSGIIIFLVSPAVYALGSMCLTGPSPVPGYPSPNLWHKATYSQADSLAFNNFEAYASFVGPGPNYFLFDAFPLPNNISGGQLQVLGNPSVSGSWTVSGTASLIGSVIVDMNCVPKTAIVLHLDPPPAECKNALSASGESVILGVDAKAQAVNCPSILKRTDVSESGMSLVLEDWTVFSADGQLASPLATATNEHARAVAGCYSNVNASQFLVVNHWEHPESNPRFMPRPDISFSDSEALTRILQRLDDGRITVRVEIGETEVVRDVEILHSTVEVPNGLVQSLGQQFGIRYVDDRRHRFSYYAIFETGRGKGTLIDSFIALPQCNIPPLCE